MLRTLPVGDAAFDIAQGLRILHKRLPIGLGIRRKPAWQANLAEIPAEPYPTWLDRDFARRLNLRERWDDIQCATGMSPDVGRVAARRQLLGAQEIAFQEWWDPSVSKLALEVRYPFLDVRVLEFLLALPALPWCQYKIVLRMAMRRRLPQGVLRRPKTNLARNPMFALLTEDRLPRQALLGMRELRPYGDVEAVVHGADREAGHGWRLPPTLHLLSLGLWLRDVS